MHSFRRAAIRVLSTPSSSSSSSVAATTIIARSGSRSLATTATIRPRPLRLGRVIGTAHSVAVQRRWNTNTNTKNSTSGGIRAEDKGDEGILESAVKSTAETGSTLAGGPAETTAAAEGEHANTNAQQARKEYRDDGNEVMDQILEAHESADEQGQVPEGLRVAETSATAGERAPGYRYIRREPRQQQQLDDLEGEDSQRRRLPGGKPEPDPKETLYIGNLFFDVTANDLRKYCEAYGVVEHATIIHNDRGKSLGFGYVTFDSVEAASRAREDMHMKIYEGRRIVVSYAQANSMRRKTMPSTRTLFIGNIAHEVTDRDLQDLFRDIANVIDVRVSVDKRTGQPRGFVHAEFIDVESAQIAKEILSRKAPYGRKLKLDFSHSNKRVRRNTETYGAGEGGAADPGSSDHQGGEGYRQ